MHGLFLALPAIILSPKRAMRQLCSLCSHNAQPLGTGRHLLAQMDVYSFPMPPFEGVAWEKRERKICFLNKSAFQAMPFAQFQDGEVAEWLKAAVLKTVERLRVPGVRIPPSPPLTTFLI